MQVRLAVFVHSLRPTASEEFGILPNWRHRPLDDVD